MLQRIDNNHPVTEFRETDLQELAEIASQLADYEPDLDWTEAARDGLAHETASVAAAIDAAQAGHLVYLAQDEDGYYFAVGGPAVHRSSTVAV